MISKSVVIAMLLSASVVVAGDKAETSDPAHKPCRMNNEGIKGGVACEKGWILKTKAVKHD